MTKNQLETFGLTHYTSHLQSALTLAEDLEIGRIACAFRNSYTLITSSTITEAVISGKLSYFGDSLPVTGDYVAFRKADESLSIIEEILPRTSILGRFAAGSEYEHQLIATNIDTAFIVMGLDHNFNINRLQRYIALCLDGGISPVCVLNKLDICENPEEKVAEVAERCSVDIIGLSALYGTGVEKIEEFIEAEKSYCLLGSSGAGKSTLLNALLGDRLQSTRAVREDDSKGRHTTTRRELFLLPDGGLVIDTPGMRELSLTVGIETINTMFDQIRELAQMCRYQDCSHRNEPECAVVSAVEEGKISADDYENYLKMRRDAERVAASSDISSKLKQRQKEKQFGKLCRDAQKNRNRFKQ